MKKVLIGAAILTVFLSGCGKNTAEKPVGIEANAAQDTTSIEEPGDVPKIEVSEEQQPELPSSEPTTQPAKDKEEVIKDGFISGIKASDVKVNLEDYVSMKFSGPKEGKTEFSDFGTATDSDTGAQMTAEIRGNLPLDVREVELSVTADTSEHTLDVAGFYFKYVASLPYDHSDPVKAQAWIEENIKSPAIKTEIGGVSFELSGSKTARFLTIGKIVSPSDATAGGDGDDLTEAEIKDALNNLNN